MSVEIIGMEKILADLERIARAESVENAVEKSCALVEASAKKKAPKGTGALRRSIESKVDNNGSDIEGLVFTNLEYAPYVEFGTGIKGNGSYPYKVEGLNLSYRDSSWVFTPDGGETFYRTKGQVAQPYMYPALKQNEKYIKQLFKDGVKDNLSKNCKGGR